MLNLLVRFEWALTLQSTFRRFKAELVDTLALLVDFFSPSLSLFFVAIVVVVLISLLAIVAGHERKTNSQRHLTSLECTTSKSKAGRVCLLKATTQE